MIRVASVVEGYGDVKAVPALLARIGMTLGLPVMSPDPIRAGEWKMLRNRGRLEKSLDLASSRDCDRVLIAVDLDDGCPVDEFVEAQRRIEIWKNGRTIDANIVFS